MVVCGGVWWCVVVCGWCVVVCGGVWCSAMERTHPHVYKTREHPRNRSIFGPLQLYLLSIETVVLSHTHGMHHNARWKVDRGLQRSECNDVE